MKPEFQNRLRDFFKEAYDRELERRAEAIDRQSSVVTAFTIIGGVIAFYVSAWPGSEASGLRGLFFALFFLGIVCAVVGFCLFAYSIHNGTDYRVLNTPKAIDDEVSAVAATLPDEPAFDAACVAGLAEALATQYRDCATHNQLANNQRDKRYNLTLKLATAGSVLLLVAAVPFLAVKREPEPTEVVIRQPIKIMENNAAPQSSTQPPKTPAASAAPSEQSEPKPASPPVVSFKLPLTLVINESFGSRRETPPPEEKKKD